MPALRERDYDEMASRVVDRFIQGGMKLADGAAEMAMDSQLNPDQIERLVQAANTMAFLRLMETQQAAGAPDLTHEFEPADTRSILQRILSAAPTFHEEPHPTEPPEMDVDGDAAPLPDEMGARRKSPADDGVPANDAPEPFPEKKDKRDKAPAQRGNLDPGKEAMVRNRQLAKLAGVFQDQLFAAENAFDDGYDRLSQQFKRAHGAPEFSSFEKDAMAVEGDEHGISIINLMRSQRDMPTLPVGQAMEKCASLHDHHLPDDYPALREFRQLVKIARQASRVTRAVSHVRSLCG